jgi:hypothetical protein
VIRETDGSEEVVMSIRSAVIGICLVLAGLCSAEEARPDAPSPQDLKLEVQALQTLYHFQFTPEQMQRLVKIAADTAPRPRPRKPAQVSEEYLQALTDLRNALVDATDEDRIDQLEDRLDELTENEKPDLDEDIKLTAAARRQVAEVLRQLKPAQLAQYLGYIADDVADPLERLQAGLDKARKPPDDDWADQRDEIAEEVGWLVAGVEMDKAHRISERVIALLDEARRLSAAQFKKQRRELDRTAEQIVGGIGPTVVLQNTVEHALAELLSNSQLSAALQARLR